MALEMKMKRKRTKTATIIHVPYEEIEPENDKPTYSGSHTQLAQACLYSYM